MEKYIDELVKPEHLQKMEPDGYHMITEFKDKINSFSELEKSWDSYNANKISPAAIKSALKTVQMLSDKNLLSYNVGVFPMRDGGIQFEFGNEYELEINIEGNLVFLEFVNDKIVDFTMGSDISQIINKIIISIT